MFASRIPSRLLLGLAAGLLLAAVSRAEGPAGAAQAEPVAAEAAGGHAAPAHIGAEGVSTDPAEFKQDLAIYTFAVFVLMLLILWRFAWGPIAAGLDKREQGIADNIAAAAKTHETAKQLLAEYERKLDAVQDRVQEILDQARRDGERTGQDLMAKARADARAERDRALREIEAATSQALKELAGKSADLAVELAGKIVGAKLNREDHVQLIQEALTKFPQTSPSRN
ncbi:MAG: F0F1 ATP synthase subunit B [Pirellulales bacterium]